MHQKYFSISYQFCQTNQVFIWKNFNCNEILKSYKTFSGYIAAKMYYNTAQLYKVAEQYGQDENNYLYLLALLTCIENNKSMQ